MAEIDTQPDARDLVRLTQQWVRQVTAAMNTDATNLARRAGLAPSTLTRFLKQAQPSSNLTAKTLQAVAGVTKIPLPPELIDAVRKPAFPAPSSHDTETSDVPVHALIGTPLLGRYHRNTQPLEWCRRLPGIARRLRVFALRMPDDSMAPWRAPNELVFVDPTWVVAEGDHALVEMMNPREPDAEPIYAVRRYLGRDRGAVRLERYGTERQTEKVQAEQVTRMQRILTWQEAAGL